MRLRMKGLAIVIIPALLVVSVFFLGEYFGKINNYPTAYKRGLNFGFGIGMIYGAPGDSFEKRAIAALFPEVIEYVKDQDNILRDQLKHGGLRFYR